MVDAVVKDFGFVDILVNNAGIASRGQTVKNTDPAEFERVVRTHAFGAWYLCHLAIPSMRTRPRGDIVMISSVATLNHAGGGAPYNMGKAALEALAWTLSKEEKKHGIHVNIVAPGLVETEMGKRLAKGAMGVDDIRKLDAVMPFGRVCQPEDVANVVRFLVSERASLHHGREDQRVRRRPGLDSCRAKRGALTSSLEGLLPRMVEGSCCLSGSARAGAVAARASRRRARCTAVVPPSRSPPHAEASRTMQPLLDRDVVEAVREAAADVAVGEQAVLARGRGEVDQLDARAGRALPGPAQLAGVVLRGPQREHAAVRLHAAHQVAVDLGVRARADHAHLLDRGVELAGHEPRRGADQLDEVGLRDTSPTAGCPRSR